MYVYEYEYLKNFEPDQIADLTDSCIHDISIIENHYKSFDHIK